MHQREGRRHPWQERHARRSEGWSGHSRRHSGHSGHRRQMRRQMWRQSRRPRRDWASGPHGHGRAGTQAAGWPGWPRWPVRGPVRGPRSGWRSSGRHHARRSWFRHSLRLLRQSWKLWESRLEPLLVTVLGARYRDEVGQGLLAVVVGVVVPAARPSGIAEAPPPLLERLTAIPLAILYDGDEILPRLLLNLLQHGLVLHHQRMLILHNLGLLLLLLLHLLEEVLLLLVLHHLLSCFFEAWQNLLLLVKTEADRLTLGERDLHRPQVCLLRDQHPLLVELRDGLLSRRDRGHPNEGTANAAGGLGGDDEDFEDFPELPEALLKLGLVDLSRESPHEELHATLLALYPRPAIVGIGPGARAAPRGFP
mmetsp:Transcript_28525/g.67786  ORF Transcript_28525/g.67786 Transcript_28525/m.67786 type:complete len:366 (+) Transcript_28525:197-1294(+)